MDSRGWDERYEDTPDLVWTATPNQFVEAELADLAPGRALDLACGEGRNAIWLAENAWKVTAVDFSAAGLRTATAVARDRGVTVEWIEADVTAYEPAAAAFDLVLIAYLHLPTEQRRAVLTAGAGALAPGGTFFYVAHDRANLSDGHGGPQDPTVLAVADEVVDDLEGLEIIRAGPIDRIVETEDGPTAAIDTLVRATRPVTG